MNTLSGSAPVSLIFSSGAGSNIDFLLLQSRRKISGANSMQLDEPMQRLWSILTWILFPSTTIPVHHLLSCSSRRHRTTRYVAEGTAMANASQPRVESVSFNARQLSESLAA